MTGRTSKAKGKSPDNVPPYVSLAAIQAAKEVYERQMKSWNKAVAEDKDIPEEDHIIVGDINVARLIVAGRTVTEIINIIAPYLEPRDQVPPRPVGAAARKAALEVIQKQRKSIDKALWARTDLPVEEHIIIGDIDVAQLVAARTKHDTIVGLIAPYLEPEPTHAAHEAAMGIIQRQLKVWGKYIADRRELPKDEHIIVGGIDVVQLIAENTNLDQALNILKAHLEPETLLHGSQGPDMATPHASLDAYKAALHLIRMQMYAGARAQVVRKRKLLQAEVIIAGGINIAQLCSENRKTQEMLDLIAPRLEKPKEPVTSMPTFTPGPLVLPLPRPTLGETAMPAGAVQMDAGLALKVDQNSHLAASGQATVGGINVARHSEERKWFNHIVDPGTGQLVKQSQTEPVTDPGAYTGADPGADARQKSLPQIEPGPQPDSWGYANLEPQPESRPRLLLEAPFEPVPGANLDQSPASELPQLDQPSHNENIAPLPPPTNPHVGLLMANAPDSAWADFDITAGDAEGFYKAVEELPEETLDSVKAIMKQTNSATPQGSDGQHDAITGGQGGDESGQDVAPAKEKDDDDTRDDSFFDFFDFDQASGFTPKVSEDQHDKGADGKGQDESQQNIEVEEEKEKDDVDTREDSFLDYFDYDQGSGK